MKYRLSWKQKENALWTSVIVEGALGSVNELCGGLIATDAYYAVRFEEIEPQEIRK